MLTSALKTLSNWNCFSSIEPVRLTLLLSSLSLSSYPERCIWEQEWIFSSCVLGCFSPIWVSHLAPSLLTLKLFYFRRNFFSLGVINICVYCYDFVLIFYCCFIACFTNIVINLLSLTEQVINLLFYFQIAVLLKWKREICLPLNTADIAWVVVA